MPHAEQAPRQLPRAAAQIERARRMLGLLVRYHGDELLFPDLLAYVLELLLSVSRMIQEESKGRRTATFADWWDSEPLADRQKIEHLRHAELKRGEVHSAPRVTTVVNAQPADFPDLLVNVGDSVSTMTWFWQDGPFAQEQVMATVQTYLAELQVAHAKAERLLGH